eukprot:1195030-Prorocentrum_minimum.AAC.2
MLTVLSQVRFSTTNTIAWAQLVRAAWFVERPLQLYGVTEFYFAWEFSEVLWQTLFAIINYFTIWLIAGWGYYDDVGNLGQPFMVMALVANGCRPLLATIIFSKRKFNTLFQVSPLPEKCMMNTHTHTHTTTTTTTPAAHPALPLELPLTTTPERHCPSVRGERPRAAGEAA